MSSHAILSPSSAYRWLACTPSARFEEQYPDEESPYAAEGTLAHDLAALLISKRDMVKQKFEVLLEDIQANPLYNPEMLDHCQDYANYVLEQAGNATLYVERQYDMSTYIPLQKGTADASFIKNDTIYVIDFKYGAGIRVTATANKQMMCYALGAYAYHAKGNTLKNVVMTIFQPRAGGVSTWELSVTELLDWAKNEAGPKGLLAIAGQGDFIAGDHCQFCKAKTVCKAFYDRFANLKKIKDKRLMDDKDTADVLTFGPSVASWVKKVEEETIANLTKGGKLPGFKLVTGRGRRTFKNEDEVVDILIGEGFESYDIFDPKLRSITDLEKKFGNKKFNDLLGDEIITIKGKPTLTTEDDDRPALDASAADEFDEEDLT